MNNNSNFLKVFSELMFLKPLFFLILIVGFFIEGSLSILTVLAVIPFADFLLDSTLSNASQITNRIVILIKYINYEPSFWFFGLFFVLINFLKNFASIFIKYLIIKIKYSVIREVITDTLDTFFSSRWEFFNKMNQGKLLNTFIKELNTIGDTLGQLATQIARIFQIFIYLIVPMFINLKLTLLTIFFVSLFAIPFIFLSRMSYKFGLKNIQTANKETGTLNEIIQSIRIIISYGRQFFAKNLYLKRYDEHVKATIKTQLIGFFPPLIFTPFAILAAIISLGILAHDSNNISELAAVLWSLIALIPLIAGLIQSNITIRNFIPSYEQLLFLKDKAKEFKEISGSFIFTKIKNNISFNNISFSYNNDPLIVDCNLKIEKGKVTVLTGPSGSGKSTIIDLLIGLQSPKSGSIFIDEKNFNEIDKNTYRNRIGYVPQDPILFDISIKENLLWSNKNATKEDIKRILEMSNSQNFIDNLQDGLDTIVGMRGANLSGGQRQRIALARALIRNPEVLILDEPISSLDKESENLISETIKKISKDITILIIAHDFSTIKESDYIYIIKNGSINERGTFDELYKNKNSYLRYIENKNEYEE